MEYGGVENHFPSSTNAFMAYARSAGSALAPPRSGGTGVRFGEIRSVDSTEALDFNA